MENTNLDIWAKEIIKKTGFIPKKEIRRGYYYTTDKVRSIIFSGLYKQKPAVLKIYDDPRLTDEPISLNSFYKRNKSKIIKVPKIYNYNRTSAKKGWLIMEKIPEKAACFIRPIKSGYRKTIASLYLEYRKTFAVKPTRKLVLAENLSADQFHIFRINRWFELCNNKETERVFTGKKPILDHREFIPRFEEGTELIRKEFKNRKMIWCHGHFNPAELYHDPTSNVYYLLDFAHTHMYPEGYEFAFIIWSDWIMSANWKMNYLNWKKGVVDWLKEFEPIAKKLKIRKFNLLMKASLVERCLGAILADICASDRADAEKKGRIKLIYHLLDELLK